MKKYYYFFGENSKINQTLCAIMISLPVFVYGACVGWLSPMTLLLQSENSPRGAPLTDVEVSWLASVAYMLCIPMNYVMSMSADRWGRKKTLIAMLISCSILWTIKVVTTEIWALIISRGMVSIIMAGSYVVCPVYIKEISEDSIRGVLGTMVMLFHVFGTLFVFIISDYLDYNTVNMICLSLPVMLILLIALIAPESPSYLVKQKRIKDATKTVAWLRCLPEDDVKVENEIELISREQIKDESSSGFIFKALSEDKILYKAFFISLVITASREVCGAITMINFAGDIFARASHRSTMVLTPNQQAMMLGAVQVCGSMVASSVVENIGRKPLLFVTSLLSGISMTVLTVWFMAESLDVYLPDWIPVTTLCISIFCDAAGLLPVSVVITGEIFSYKYRSSVLAFTMIVACCLAFLQLVFFKSLASAVGVHVPFGIFATVCILLAFYVLLVVPETKSRKLEVIYEDLRKR